MDPDRVLRVILELNADIVALQEVGFSDKGGKVSLSFIREVTGMHVVPGLTFAKKESSFGNLLLSKRPLDQVERIDLSVDDREPRGAIFGRLTMGGIPIKVIATHLGLRQYERRRQWRCLDREIEPHYGEGIVLMGDLNEWNPMGWVEWRLRSFFGSAPALRTYPSWCPVLALDRILFYPKDIASTLAIHRSPSAKIASDHLPVVGSIEV
jgi:endonuclease/exonuclease/phosphatase family metal-dependent hydrolase